MFRNAYRLPFKLLGIPVLLDVTFLLILPLLAWLIGAQIKRYADVTGLPVNVGALDHGLVPYILGLIAAIGLFISVVIHELGHSIVARHYGVQVKSITLWLLGGMAQFDEMPRQRGAEAIVAIAGPITSILLAGTFWGLFRLVPPGPAAVAFTLAYLAQMNFVLAVFNLVPAMPLDGGRVLRSLLALRMPYLRATQVAAGISKFLALLMGFWGLMSGNMFLILVAFFVYMAVNAETQQTLVADLLRGMGIADLMTREVKTVTPDTTVTELTARMLREHVRGYPVVNGQLMGIVTLKDVQGAEPTTRVEQVMSRNPATIPERGSALDAFTQMSGNDFGRLIVTANDGHMVGIITKSDLMRAIQVRMVALLPRTPTMPTP